MHRLLLKTFFAIEKCTDEEAGIKKYVSTGYNKGFK